MSCSSLRGDDDDDGGRAHQPMAREQPSAAATERARAPALEGLVMLAMVEVVMVAGGGGEGKGGRPRMVVMMKAGDGWSASEGTHLLRVKC